MELRDKLRQAQDKWIFQIDAEVLDLLGKTSDFDHEPKSVFKLDQLKVYL